MRPTNLSEVIGHNQITGNDSVLRSLIDSSGFGGAIPSVILWGPPGCGKTTIAKIVANQTDSDFVQLSAISSGIKDLRSSIDKAKKSLDQGRPTILFIDEIHRFNKTQQDALLGAVENGIISFIGATTENPSFEVNRALLSRATVLKLGVIESSSIMTLLQRAIEKDVLLSKYEIEVENLNRIAVASSGDARIALNILELALRMSYNKNSDVLTVTDATVDKAIAGRARNYDKSDDYHYDNISAFIKSMRGSDPDATLIWLLNMIDGGEDPKFIARRMLIFASEDIGLADSNALIIANSAFETYEKIGLPEGLYPLCHCAVYLAAAPKSNTITKAMKAAKAVVKSNPDPEVPYNLRNGVTQLMKDSGYGKGYKYPHDFPMNFVDEDYYPSNVGKTKIVEFGNNLVEVQTKKIMKNRWGNRYD
jgi:putative ATPase